MPGGAIECPGCGYDLRGVISAGAPVARCPECGGGYATQRLKRFARANDRAVTPEFGLLVLPFFILLPGGLLLWLAHTAADQLGADLPTEVTVALIGFVVVLAAWLGTLWRVSRRLGGWWALGAALAMHLIYAVYLAAAMGLVAVLGGFWLLLWGRISITPLNWTAGLAHLPVRYIVGGLFVLGLVAVAYWGEMQIRRRCSRIHVRRAAALPST